MRARIQTAEALLDLNRDDDAAKLQVGRDLRRGEDGHVSDQSCASSAHGRFALLAESNRSGGTYPRARRL